MRVGRVDDVRLVDGEAEVVFSVEDTQPILAGTTLAIRYQNLIGQRFLALVPGGGSTAVVPPGSKISKASTQTALDLTVLLNGFQPLFEILSPADINRLSASIVAVLQGEGGSIVSLLRETATLSTNLADRDQLIGRVITNFSEVLANIGEKDAQVDTLVTQLRRLARAAAADRGQIGASIQALSTLTDSTTALLVDLRPQLRRDITKLERVTGVYAREKGAFAAAVKGLPPALEAFSRSLHYGSWINLYTCNLLIARPGAEPERFADTGANSKVCA